MSSIGDRRRSAAVVALCYVKLSNSSAFDVMLDDLPLLLSIADDLTILGSRLGTRGQQNRLRK